MNRGVSLAIVLFLWPWIQGSLNARAAIREVQDLDTVRVKIGFHMEKLYEVDELSESYKIDGYLTAAWKSPNAIGRFDEMSFEDGDVLDALGDTVWWPHLEFMNIVGDREVPNRSLTVESDGRVTYDERFNATFHSDMDFRKYPFDTQTLTVGIESFSFPDSVVVFEVGSVRLPHHEPEDQEWTLSKPTAAVGTKAYSTIDGEPESYSHFEFALTAERNPGYFVWQFFLPLVLIIAASWAVFWISSFSDQIQTLFTLMLTVVAFNFYTSTLLPRLPYNTFIEITVISGYVSIFLAILVIVVSNSVERRKQGGSSEETGYESTPKIMRVCRWLFPLGYSLFLLGLYVSFHI